MPPKHLRSRIPLKIIGYDPETRKPIYENRKTCQFCQRTFKTPASRGNHELHYCLQNPEVKKIKSIVRRSIKNPSILTLTITYKLIQVTVNQILSNPTKYYPYDLFDKQTDQIIQIRQAMKWLKTVQLNTIVNILEYQTETTTITPQ